MSERRPANILLVEDDPDDQEITRRAFQRGKIRNNLYVVSDGEEALEFLRHEGRYANSDEVPRPDVVLLDLNMPRMDGLEVLREMHSDPSLSLITVIVLTTSREEGEIVRSYQLGCRSFITKPVDVDKFTHIIADLDHYWLEVVVLPPEP